MKKQLEQLSNENDIFIKKELEIKKEMREKLKIDDELLICLHYTDSTISIFSKQDVVNRQLRLDFSFNVLENTLENTLEDDEKIKTIIERIKQC